MNSIWSNTICTFLFQGCFDGDLKLDGSTPMIYWNERWSQICGHHFWDNDNGVNKFCKTLGYDYGHLRKNNKKSQSRGFWIGRCKKHDRFPYCTSRCNKMSLGGTCKTNFLGGPSCNRGNHKIFTVKCHGLYGSFSTCQMFWNVI